MDLALPPMPFSSVHVPTSGNATLQIPADMRNSGIGGANSIIGLPAGVVQVIVTWKGVEPITIRHFVGSTSTYETAATIPASTTVKDRSTGVMTLASDKAHGIQLSNGNGTNWNANTLSKGYVAGVQVMPMGTAADITGGGSLLRVDNSVGTRVFLGDTMIYGDTGWRDVTNAWTAQRQDTFTVNSIKVRREGGTVWMQGYCSALAGSTLPYSGILFAQQVGWRMAGNQQVSASLQGSVPVAIGTGSTAARLAYNYPTSSNITGFRFLMNWHTSDSWPSTLPGTPG